MRERTRTSTLSASALRCAGAGAMLCAMALGTLALPATAHGTRAGDLTIDHPYAPPTVPGATVGSVYFRSLANRGREPDRLVGAHTSAAREVRIQHGPAGNTAAGADTATIEIPAGATLKLRHDGDTLLQLVGLKQPLRDGDRFALRLRFERAGEHEVMVWVQTPRQAAKP